jgi:cell division transport system permease protein
VDFNHQRFSCCDCRITHQFVAIIDSFQPIHHKTMQMVGATKSFIRKPFVMRSIKLGMIGAGLAVLALMVLIYVEKLSKFGNIRRQSFDRISVSSGLGIGILITWLSTYFATQRFLNLRTDDLY